MRLKPFFSVMAAVLLAVLPSAARPETKKAESLREFAMLAAEHTERLESSFSIPCDWTVSEELKKPSSVNPEISQLSGIMTQAGCFGSFRIAWADDRVELTDVSYYTGWRIARLWEAGRTDALSGREMLILERAQALVSGVSGTDLEKERFIYDALCASVTYDVSEDGTGDKDNAAGALLNGRADCDGYADAMLLCCTLAGIPCRYIHGKAITSLRMNSRDGSHLWNLVRIGGSWLMCDVTWGDRGKEPSYLFFNLGRQDASLSYHWNTTVQVAEIAPSADFAVHFMPDQRPVTVTTREEVYRAAREKTMAGQARLMLCCPEEVFWQTDREGFNSLLFRAGFSSWAYQESGRLFEASDVKLPDTPFRFCDTREDILFAIRVWADADVHTFTLYFHPDLAEEMFSDGLSPLQQVLAESCLEGNGSFRYSAEAGCVVMENVSFSTVR